MLELGVVILASAIVMTLLTDAVSGAGKMLRAARPRDKIQVAEHH
ncbi:MAG TPA: hypothetical protein PKY87_11490 [Terricaulis sp.]|jgi:hypothetical protein|nr:hypothetical protein [Terricaulis sp.]